MFLRWLGSMLVAVLLTGLWATPAIAQTPTVATIHRFSLAVIPLTGDPVTATPLTCGVPPMTTPCIATLGITTPTAAPCNQAPLPALPGTPVNPKLAGVDDPFTAGRQCHVNFPLNMPDGQFRIVTFWESDNCVVPPATTPSTCAGVRSVAVGPFTVVSPRTPPAAPTAPRILAMLKAMGRDLFSSATQALRSVMSGPSVSDTSRPTGSK